MHAIAINSSFRTPRFDDPDFEGHTWLRELARSEAQAGPPEIPRHAIPHVGTLALLTPEAAIVVAHLDGQPGIPHVFHVQDTRTALGFDWPIIWTTSEATIVPTNQSDEIIIVRGIPTLPYVSRDDLWHRLMPRSVCAQEITLFTSP